MNLYIKTATIKDILTLQQLNYEFNHVWVPENIIKDNMNNSNEIILIAFDDEYPIGFACGQIKTSICYNYKDAEITEVFIRPSYRRQKAATAIVSKLEQCFRALGCNHISLLTGKTNFAAQSTYKSCGYELKDKVIMVKYFYQREH